jgi:hypothetical protein
MKNRLVVAEIGNGCGMVRGVSMVINTVGDMFLVLKSLKIPTMLMDTDIYS